MCFYAIQTDLSDTWRKGDRGSGPSVDIVLRNPTLLADFYVTPFPGWGTRGFVRLSISVLIAVKIPHAIRGLEPRGRCIGDLPSVDKIRVWVSNRARIEC